MIEAIGEIALNKAVEAAIDSVRSRWGATISGVTSIDVRDLKSTLKAHQAMVNRWASEISFRDLRKAKPLQTSFVDLDLSLGQFIPSSDGARGKLLKVSDITSLDEHLVILGSPGAGKTTSLKKIALNTFSSLDTKRIVLFIRLRDHGDSDSLSDIILQTLGLIISVDRSVDGSLGKDGEKAVKRRFTLKHLNQLHFRILLDGLDEIPPTLRARIIADLRHFIMHSEKSKFIVTCRSADFFYHFEKADVMTLLPLSETQIEDFTDRWLGRERAADFREKIKNNPYSGTEVRPLTLAHLCAIYERSGTVSDKPRTIYRKIVRLLLEEWDEQRSIQRTSRYANFATDRKEDFLQAIAYQITTAFNSLSFSHSELQLAYLKIHQSFDLPRSDAEKVVREIESHTGLIVQSDYEQFEFAHKSIQEFLTASYVLRLPSIPESFIYKSPNEVALAVALSSQATHYFSSVVRRLRFDRMTNPTLFSRPFLHRLVVEKVDFTSGIDLGFAVIKLYSGTFFPATVSDDRHNTGPGRKSSHSEESLFEDTEATIEIFTRFLSVPSILKSVQLAFYNVISAKAMDNVYEVVLRTYYLSDEGGEMETQVGRERFNVHDWFLRQIDRLGIVGTS
jgi:hypothetical protein